MISIGILSMCLAIFGMWVADKYMENGAEFATRAGAWVFMFGGFSVAAGVYGWLTRLPVW